MKTNFNSNYNQNFGMALYMTKAHKINKVIGKKCADEAEKARPALQKLAEDVDLYVNINNSDRYSLQGFRLTVTKLIKNPIKRLFSKPKKYLDDGVYKFETADNNEKISELLIKKAEKLKAELKKYSD